MNPEVPKWDLRLQMVRDRRFGRDRRGKRGVKSMDSSQGEVRIERCVREGWCIDLRPRTDANPVFAAVMVVVVVAAVTLGAVIVVGDGMGDEEMLRKMNPAFWRDVD